MIWFSSAATLRGPSLFLSLLSMASGGKVLGEDLRGEPLRIERGVVRGARDDMRGGRELGSRNGRGDRDRAHARAARGFDAERSVLEDEAFAGQSADSPRRQQEEIGLGLAAR